MRIVSGGSYDLTGDGANSYVYDVENRLVSTGGALQR
jgi:hypothetical protein